jgi:hypothetical protein
MFFWFQIFLNLAILIVKKMEKNTNSRKNVNNKKQTCQKIGEKTFKEKMLLLMRNFKI